MSRRVVAQAALGLAFALLAGPLTALASHPVPPVALRQLRADGSALCTGCSTLDSTVRLGAASSSSTCPGTYALDIEVRPVTVQFTGVPTHRSASMYKGSCTQVNYPLTSVPVTAGVDYHWQVREVVSGRTSARFLALRLPPRRCGAPSVP